MKKSRRYKSLILWIVGVLVLTSAVVFLTKRHDLNRALERASLPEAMEYEEVKENALLPTSAPIPLESGRPEVAEATPASQVDGTLTGPAPATAIKAVNLAVPFTPQAPFANWEPPYKEFCEEASALMAAKYLQGEDIPSPEAADAALLAIKAFEDKRFGYYEDTTAAETAVILREHFGIKAVKVLDNPTADDFREALKAGQLVIVPAAGRLLGNPYYTPPGPLYHMLVVKGVAADGKFITNDPGTRRGADFLYTQDTLLNAIHDWRPDGDITQGKKVVLIVG